MIATSVFILALWGGLSSILVSPKSNRIISVMTLMITSVIFFFLCRSYLFAETESFSFEWLKYMSLKVDVDLSSNITNYTQILPVFLLSLISMLIAVFNSEEVKKQSFCSLVALNLCAVSGAICAVNILQLLVCISLITILGYCIIDDMDARKKYAFYNLLADLSLFSVCSLAYGYIGSLEISALPMFDKLGGHRDLVAVLLAFSISLKLGLFMFHNQFYDMSVLHFNRLSYILFCTTPLSGLIILQKFFPLTLISEFIHPLLITVLILTIFCGIYSSIVIDNLKEKNIGIIQILYGFGVLQAFYGSAKFETIETMILFGGAIFSLMMYGIYFASSYELYISKMGGFIKGIKFGFVILSAALISVLHYIVNSLGISWQTILFSFVLILIISHIFRQVFWGQTRADERVMALLKNPAWYLSLAIIIFSAIIWQKGNSFNIWVLGSCLGCYMFLLSFNPLSKLKNFYNLEYLQESDVFEEIFDFLIITPLTILGRILWLLVDFILIERTIINSLSNATNLLIRGVSHLNVFSAKLYFLYILLGFGLMALLAYMGHK